MNPYREIVQFIRSRQPFALGLVLSAEGSTPREAGTRAIFEADGRIHGTLGGGAVEAEAQRQAVSACRTGQATVFAFDLAGETASGREPICGGRMRVLVDPTGAKDEATKIGKVKVWGLSLPNLTRQYLKSGANSLRSYSMASTSIRTSNRSLACN